MPSAVSATSRSYASALGSSLHVNRTTRPNMRTSFQGRLITVPIVPYPYTKLHVFIIRYSTLSTITRIRVHSLHRREVPMATSSPGAPTRRAYDHTYASSPEQAHLVGADLAEFLGDCPRAEGDYVWVEIEDSGGNWTETARHDGRGHGLAIVRALASDCGIDGGGYI